MLTLTPLHGFLGSDDEDMQKQYGILTSTSINGLLSSNEEDFQNQNGALFQCSQTTSLDAKTTYNGFIS